MEILVAEWTRHAVSQRMIQQAEENEMSVEKGSARWREAASVFTPAISQRSKPSRSECSSRSSKLSAKRQEAAVEVAAAEATLKVMEEMECERKELEFLKKENVEKVKAVEQKRRQPQCLEMVKQMNAAQARLKVYEQENNSDEDISDLLNEGINRTPESKSAPHPVSHCNSKIACLSLNPGAQPFTTRQDTSKEKRTIIAKQEDSIIILVSALAECINISHSPVPEPTVFSGDPIPRTGNCRFNH